MGSSVRVPRGCRGGVAGPTRELPAPTPTPADFPTIRQRGALLKRRPPPERAPPPSPAASATSRASRLSVLTMPRRFCIIFGIDAYASSSATTSKSTSCSTSSLPDLFSAVSDATRVRKVLVERLGFECLAFLTNAECTLTKFLEAFDRVERVLNAATGCEGEDQPKLAQFIFFFAGHGVLDARGKGWLALSGFSLSNKHATGVPMVKLKSLSESLMAVQQLWVCDCCHCGRILFEGLRGTSASTSSSRHHSHRSCISRGLRNPAELLKHPAIIVITAATGTENSIEKNSGGLFTTSLIAGLLATEEVITAADLLKFIRDRVIQSSDSKMHPQGGRLLLTWCGLECCGEFVLPDNPRRTAKENMLAPRTPTNRAHLDARSRKCAHCVPATRRRLR